MMIMVDIDLVDEEVKRGKMGARVGIGIERGDIGVIGIVKREMRNQVILRGGDIGIERGMGRMMKREKREGGDEGKERGRGREVVKSVDLIGMDPKNCFLILRM